MGVKLELLTDINVSLMIEKGIGGRICYTIHRYGKNINKYMKDCDKNKESSYIPYLNASNLHGWVMSQRLPLEAFKWKKNMLKFDEDFIKNYDEDSGKRYFLKVYVEYPNIHCDLPF